MYTCSVCKSEFSDSWDHLLTPTASPNGHGGAMLDYVDEAHKNYANNLKTGNYKKGKCFCGGHITIYVGGEDSWEVSCDDCKFLFDED